MDLISCIKFHLRSTGKSSFQNKLQRRAASKFKIP